MTNANQQPSLCASIHATTATLGAGLLILLGIVFQLWVLGYGRLNTDSFWSLSLISGTIWNMLNVWLKSTALQETIQFWPLLLVAAGVAVLLSMRRSGQSYRLLGRRGGENHA